MKLRFQDKILRKRKKYNVYDCKNKEDNYGTVL